MPRKRPNEMNFLEHLEELRVRLLWILGAAAAGTAGAFYFAPRLVNLLLAPGGERFQYIKPAEAFVVHLAVSFIAGLVVMSPFIFYQIWRFVAPGLLPREKRYALPFVFFTSLCFVAGVVFGYYLLFPAMGFFRSFETDRLVADWTLGSYASLTLRLLLATGLIFEAPIVIFFLARLGIVSPRLLTAKWKYVILIVFVVAAALTPGPDVFTQSLLAVPLLLLYGISIGVAWLAYPRRKPEEEEEEDEAEPEEEPPRTPSPYAG
ncbi:MAG: twin-arginine translocase subunit TatC [Candidatus Coatesbacteria bacterium]|nr:MAG: twin-arginine translocase subunit TatC [Candidatus Coatesbacteria bacterium]